MAVFGSKVAPTTSIAKASAALSTILPTETGRSGQFGRGQDPGQGPGRWQQRLPSADPNYCGSNGDQKLPTVFSNSPIARDWIRKPFEQLARSSTQLWLAAPYFTEPHVIVEASAARKPVQLLVGLNQITRPDALKAGSWSAGGQVLYPPVSRQAGWLQAGTFSWSARTAATMITRIGRTSSHLRVLKPQYGLCRFMVAC